jgi:hypothetical protein
MRDNTAIDSGRRDQRHLSPSADPEARSRAAATVELLDAFRRGERGGAVVKYGIPVSSAARRIENDSFIDCGCLRY